MCWKVESTIPHMDGRTRRVFSISAMMAVCASAASAQASAARCLADNGGLKLQPGFCAAVFADSLPGPRRIAVAANGDVFVAATGGRGGAGGGIIALRELNRSGRADTREQFATGFRSNEIALFDGYLYAESSPLGRPGGAPGDTTLRIAIVRYALKAGSLTPSGAPDTIIQNIPFNPGHTSRNFAIANDGSLYLNIGSATNACQAKDRVPREPGINPCVELETRAGIWKFDARKTHQTPSAANHFARGIRNAVGIAINPADGKLWTTQHGRDDLASWYKQLGMDSVAAIKYNAENPAEELMQVIEGDDFGWPYCYYSVVEKHLVQAPEYGGDGKKVEQCANRKEPAAVLPGHWAPNGLQFYTGSAFPAKYKNGAFIAFHGSWNRAPEKQGGFNVVFQPLSNGRASGPYEVFADNFAPSIGGGRANAPRTEARPTATAQAPDGSLYVVSDNNGRIYKIIYTGK